MTRSFIILAAALISASLTGCGKEHAASEKNAPGASSSSQHANVLNLKVAGLRFEGPHEIASGWTAIRLENPPGMTHFALVYRLPEGVTAERLSTEVIDVFQEMLNATNDGDTEKATALAATIPDWTGDIVYWGGPGLLSGGETSEATMYLKPGRYIVECYLKSNGVLHNYNPDPNEFGMVHPLTVLDKDGGGAEPASNVTLDVSSAGYEISDGAFRVGPNVVRVNFKDQKKYAGFVGHDAHLFRIDADTDLGAVSHWMNFTLPDGLQTPAPAHFVGGIHDMPAGETGYFTVNLAPGDYGVIAEIPDPKEQGFLKTFTVPQ